MALSRASHGTVSCSRACGNILWCVGGSAGCDGLGHDGLGWNARGDDSRGEDPCHQLGLWVWAGSGDSQSIRALRCGYLCLRARLHARSGCSFKAQGEPGYGRSHSLTTFVSGAGKEGHFAGFAWRLHALLIQGAGAGVPQDAGQS